MQEGGQSSSVSPEEKQDTLPTLGGQKRFSEWMILKGVPPRRSERTTYLFFFLRKQLAVG